MNKYFISLVFIACHNGANCKPVNLYDMLDKYIPNIFVRWSGIVIKRSWKEILKNEFANINKLTGLDKKFGKRYSYEVGPDYECGIDPNIDYKKSCLGILRELNIYKNMKTVEKFFSKDQLQKNKKHLDNLVNGNVSLDIVQVGYDGLKRNCSNTYPNSNADSQVKSVLVNIIFKSADVYYSVIISMSPSDTNAKAIVKSINIETDLPLKTSNDTVNQVLQIKIDLLSDAY